MAPSILAGRKIPQRRLKQHNMGNGAKYTRMHRPVKLVYTADKLDLSTALQTGTRNQEVTHANRK